MITTTPITDTVTINDAGQAVIPPLPNISWQTAKGIVINDWSESIKSKLAEIGYIVGAKKDPILLNATISEASTSYSVTWGRKTISKFILRKMPGCWGSCISMAVEVLDPFKGKGIGSILEQVRAELCAKFGSTICTVVADNYPQIRIMKKGGWKKIGSFINPHTSHTVFMYLRINSPPPSLWQTIKRMFKKYG